jgi:cytochrome c553
LVISEGAWRPFFLALWCALLPLGAVAQTPASAAPATLGAADKALDRGAKLVGICANCHGPNGVSQAPEIPHLAGQQSAYLHEQMRRFADGRRKDPFMARLIRAMSDAERADAVAYLSQQRPAPAKVLPAAQVADGQRYYQRVCFRCHGPQAQGEGLVPRIAGQQAGYVVKSLRRYRDGTGERLEPVMAANTRLMSDGEIDAVAAYLSTLR